MSVMDKNAVAIRDLGQTVGSQEQLNNTLTLDSDSNKDSKMGLRNPLMAAQIAAATQRHKKNKTTIIHEKNQSPTESKH